MGSVSLWSNNTGTASQLNTNLQMSEAGEMSPPGSGGGGTDSGTWPGAMLEGQKAASVYAMAQSLYPACRDSLEVDLITILSLRAFADPTRARLTCLRLTGRS